MVMAQRPARRTLLAFPVAQGTQVCLEFVLNADQAINRVSIGHAAFAAKRKQTRVLLDAATTLHLEIDLVIAAPHMQLVL